MPQISSFIYPATDAPRYYKGLAMCLAWLVMSAVLAGVMWVYLRAANRRKDARNAARGPWTLQQKELQTDDGDDADFFTYVL